MTAITSTTVIVTIALDAPRDIPDRLRGGVLEETITVDHVTWQHTYNAATDAETLSVRAANAETHRGDSWHLIAGLADLVRDVPAWVPAPPAGWNLHVLAQMQRAVRVA